VSALQVLQSVARSGRTLAQWLEGVQLFPQRLINVRLQPGGQDWRTNTALADTQKAVLARLNGRGRVLIRPSGTEPLLRVMVEAEDKHLADECAQSLADAVSA
jgi:phosphoglucosamine mutase